MNGIWIDAAAGPFATMAEAREAAGSDSDASLAEEAKMQGRYAEALANGATQEEAEAIYWGDAR